VISVADTRRVLVIARSDAFVFSKKLKTRRVHVSLQIMDWHTLTRNNTMSLPLLTVLISLVLSVTTGVTTKATIVGSLGKDALLRFHSSAT